MKQKLLSLICLCLFASLSAAPVWDTPTPVLRGDNIMWNRCGSSTAEGGMIYVWSDSHRGSRDLYALRVDTDGNAMWEQPLLLVDSPYYETAPIIVKSSDNHYIIAYTQYRGENFATIKAQKFTADGVRYWQSDGVTVCSNERVSYEYELVPDASGGAFFIWKEDRNNARDIYVQRLNGSGVIQMAVNGVAIGDNSGSESSFSAVSDGSGGCLVMYQVNYTGSSSLFVKRVNPNGSVAWGQIVGTAASYWIYDISLSPRIGDSFVASWLGMENDIYQLKTRKIGLNGSLQWSNPIIVAPGPGQPQLDYLPTEYKTTVSGNNLIYAWCNAINSDVFAQKIDMDGNMLWGANGVTVCGENDYQQGVRISSDNAGGCVISWDDYRNGSMLAVYAQLLNSDGIPAWQTNGLLLSNGTHNAFYALPRFSGSNIHFAWADFRTGSSGIFNQVVSPSGSTLQQTGGFPFRQGIDSNSLPEITIARNSDVAVIWRDYRGSYLGDRIYFQFINPDGSVVLEANGRPVTLNSSDSQTNPSAVASPDGKLAVTWMEGDLLKAQLIDIDGSRLWGDDGMVVAEFDIPMNTVSKIAYENGAFYVAYEKLFLVTYPNNAYVRRIFANKIQNGQLAWGPEGVLVTQPGGDYDSFDCYLSTTTGRYVIWQRTDLNFDSYGCQIIYAKLLDENGSAAAGWPDAGLALSDYLNWDTIQWNAVGELTDAGLFVVWQDYRTDYTSSLYGQLVSPQGVLLWDSGGLELCPSVSRQEHPDILKGSDIAVFWSEETSMTSKVIKAQKLSPAGQPQWGDTGLLLTPDESGTYCNYPSAQRYANGGIVVAWNSFIFDQIPDTEGMQYRYINPDGTLAGNTQIISNFSEFADRPFTSVLNDEVYLVWPGMDVYSFFDDSRIPGYEPYRTIYAQKLGNEVVSIDDSTAPSAAIILEQNYPNPFNPVTSIGFSLKKPSDATLSIYNLKGQKVKTLQKGWLDKGRHTLVWDGNDDRGNPCSSGIYYYRLNASGESRTQKMLLLK